MIKRIKESFTKILQVMQKTIKIKIVKIIVTFCSDDITEDSVVLHENSLYLLNMERFQRIK